MLEIKVYSQLAGEIFDKLRDTLLPNDTGFIQVYINKRVTRNVLSALNN
ncbi:MAG: hypothetical protein J7K04_00090 [Spirochaetales bacterium]|nr:hypothetical protein [Spirochaetales bacterium]